MEDKLKEMKKRSKNTSDLSDIVLEKDSKGAVNGKKWLLTAAAAILLFLIVLVVMKMLNKPGLGSQENLASAGDNVDAITQSEVQAATTDTVDENIFKKEPIIDEKVADSSDTDLKFEEMVRKLKEQDKIAGSPDNAGVKQEDLSNVVKEVKQEEIKPAVEVVDTPPAPKKLEDISNRAKASIPPANTKKELVKKATQKTAPATKQDGAANTMKGFFIQVGATAKSFPQKSFLQKVKKAGFDYIVHSVNINNKVIKKVLVGPYKTRAAAQSVLPAIKSNLNPNAYVYRMK